MTMLESWLHVPVVVNVRYLMVVRRKEVMSKRKRTYLSFFDPVITVTSRPLLASPRLSISLASATQKIRRDRASRPIPYALA